MRKKQWQFLFFLILSFSIYSKSVNAQASAFSDLIVNRFDRQWIIEPQEKVYLQTDKPYYSAGEDIWFKGYLVNATTLVPNALSQFLYVELINKSDTVLYRVKIKKDSLGFEGHIKLKPEIPTGYYALRAYTYWMQNADKDFFFNRSILIGNAIDDRVLSNITYGKPVDGLVPVTLSFTDGSHSPIAGKRVDIIQNWDSSLKKKMVMVTDKSGTVSWKISVNPNDNSKKSIDIAINDEKFKKNFYMPEFSSDFDVQFFPESGSFLNNDLQTIAFKAIGKDGLSVKVSGKVFTDKNEEITDFTTLNKGMGKFSIQTQPNESYYALVKTAEGIEKRFELPRTEAKAVDLHLLFNRGEILYKVVNQTNIPDKSLYLLLHSRGKVYVIESLKLLEGKIAESSLPPGIVSFSVIDSLGHTFCERMYFARNDSFPIISMKSDKTVYGKREPVNLSLNIHTASGEPVAGSFSISITDNHTVKLDSLADNIQSNLLLSSDIKGYVENPAAYFVNNSPLTREKTDVLMMTQAWRRFNTADVVKGIYKKPEYYLEIGQSLSGKVLNLFNKPSKKCNITMISPQKSLIRLTQTDNDGRYLIEGIDFPDSTTFVLKAKKPRSIPDVEIVADPDNFPISNVFIPTPLKANNEVQDEYFKQSKDKYYYDGGMRVINLGEVTVTAEKKQDTQSEYYSGMADNEVTSKELDKMPDMNIMNIFYTIPGVQVMGDKVTIRGRMNSPMFLVDDIEMTDITEINYLTADDIESIQIFKGAGAAIFGGRGGNGVIAITLKKGVVLKANTSVSMTLETPLGYQKPSEFYVPKYDVDSIRLSDKPDLRTTIYWNPKLVSDKTGTVHMKFYTADDATDYSVVLEGLTKSGEICRYVGTLKREDN
ncbi:MAG: TonB-dependent receptor plug domain-containing protein [Paludibacter sp.]|nr:TonB-dependent receptor plug domain-containing protein [Paludibacter sp.]